MLMASTPWAYLRDRGLSLLSTNNHAYMHEINAIRRRSINSPPQFPLRQTGQFALLLPSVPTGSRLQFNAESDSNDGNVNAEINPDGVLAKTPQKKTVPSICWRDDEIIIPPVQCNSTRWRDTVP